MAFRKNLVAAAVGSVLGATSFGALAGEFHLVDNASGDASDPVKFAEEVKADDSNSAVIPSGMGSSTPATSLETIKSKLGWGFNTGEDIYIRLDLTMGGSSGKVTFASAPVLSVSIGNLAVTSTEQTRLDGGASETYAIYKISGIDTETSPDDVVDFSFGDASAFTATAKSGAIELTYSISTNEDLSSTSALYTDKTSLVQFDTSFEFSSSAALEATADVESSFLKFTGDQSTEAVAKFKFIATSGDDQTYIFEGSNTATVASIGAIFSSDTTLDVVGDFTMTEDEPGSGDYTNAKSRVFLSSDSGCSSSDTTADSVAADKATFEGFNSAEGTDSTETYVCVTANGSAIVEGTYNLVLNADGVDNSDSNGMIYDITGETTLSEVGSIDRNGTQLITPYLTIADGYISRVMLSNTGAQDIDYTASVITDDGNSASVAAGASGTVKAGTNLHIDAADSGKGRPYLVDSFTTKQRGAVLFTFVGANSDIQGVYQTINTANGEIQNIVMQRPGGGNGE
ncbi:hypothetical protein [Candidatus Albibeggiatoa sp. nov. NOAA]|uniref:hypothetical protein n=1 Tax=Candidatus Albibeggiatoa sp. nov. NOAA TaxID=3162724 RepID=UPI0032F499D0|nr:hypothetical protein [Thiotrichaceae bacterium]